MQLRLDDDVHEYLQELARRERRSMNQMVQVLLLAEKARNAGS